MTVTIACIILFVTIIGILIIWLVRFFSLICVIVATIRASEGKLFRYPLSIRLVK
ncbi:MAG TPA: DUF4870 domain-containing protein [Chitinophagaceae bacterium]|nr:DUF4870 domain-containing protein [Chitinophagaceae bacterium]